MSTVPIRSHEKIMTFQPAADVFKGTNVMIDMIDMVTKQIADVAVEWVGSLDEDKIIWTNLRATSRRSIVDKRWGI
jgi:hypothetical protein